MNPTRPRPSPTRTPIATTVSLRRWLCAWLALWMALQATSSALLGLHGTWHRHRPTSAAAPALPSLALRWQHGGATAAVIDIAHARMHDAGVVHRHAATDDSLWTPADEAASEAIGHLASVLAGGAALQWSPEIDARHVRADAGAWSATLRTVAPPLRPPRA